MTILSHQLSSQIKGLFLEKCIHLNTENLRAMLTYLSLLRKDKILKTYSIKIHS